MKTHILFLIHDLGGGGAEKVLCNLVNHMDKDIFDITVMTLFDVGPNRQTLNSYIHYKSVWKKPFPMNSRILRIFPPELLHKCIIRDYYDIEIAYLEGTVCRIICGCRNPRTKIFAWQHSQPIIEENAHIGFRNFAEANKYLARYNAIACVSDTIRQTMEKWYPLIHTFRTVYNTNNTDLIADMSKEQLDIALKDDEIKLCAVGRVISLKRFDLVARIHKRLRDKGYPIHTYILGTGPDERKIQEYVKANGVADSFTLVGYRQNPYNLMAACDMFICSSENEGFSTATTEALLLGLAVVTTPVSGMEELLGKNNEFGIIAGMSEDELYAALKMLLDNHELMEHYKIEGKKSGSRFLADTTVKNTTDFLCM